MTILIPFLFDSMNSSFVDYVQFEKEYVIDQMDMMADEYEDQQKIIHELMEEDSADQMKN